MIERFAHLNLRSRAPHVRPAPTSGAQLLPVELASRNEEEITDARWQPASRLGARGAPKFMTFSGQLE